MADTITCKNCGAEIEVSEALRHEVEDKILLAERKRHEDELDKAKAEAGRIAKKEAEMTIELAKKEADTELEIAKKKLEAEMATSQKKASAEQDLLIKSLRDDAESAKEDSKKLRENLTELTKVLREERKARASVELEAQKKLAEEENKIREDATKIADEKYSLKLAENEKKLADTQKALEEAQRKAAQGSQQTQGEVLELELERLLKAEFPLDDIVEVKKGVRGADVKQDIINSNGQHCGVILWETKNGQWQNPWPGKLREDQRQAKADMAVLVCENLPEGVDNFVFRNNVWITSRRSVIGLAYALRHNIIQLHMTKLAGKGKDEKMETLFNYLIGPEFRHRIEAIVESFTGLQDEIEREKRTSQAKWTRQEKEVRKVIDHTVGLYGDLQGITGRALQKIQTLELPEPEGKKE